MPQTCSICRNPRRDKINEALLVGESLRTVAKRFGTSVTALHRHRKEIPKKIVKATEARDIVLGDTLLTQVQGLIGKATAILDRAEASGDDRRALQGVREVRETLHLLGKITGEIEPERSKPQPVPMFVLPGNAIINVNPSYNLTPDTTTGDQTGTAEPAVADITPEADTGSNQNN